MKTGTKPPLSARNANEAAFVDAEPDNGFDWVQYHGEGQRKHQSAIGQGHYDRQPAFQRPKKIVAEARKDATPPHDAAMEKALLCCIMLKPSVLDDVLPLVGPEDFLDDGRGHDPANGIVFSHLIAMHNEGLPVGDILLTLPEGLVSTSGSPGSPKSMLSRNVPTA